MRLATLTEFRRKVQVGFYTRLRPDAASCELRDRFGEKTLDTLQKLREQRVKQLASRIVEAALGIGRVRLPETGKSPRRPRTQVDRPCHVVVMESLTHYRPDEMRTRREKRQLMEWCSAMVRDYLKDACQLNGLLLREVSAKYTSHQCSRTGLPRLRCADVKVKQFLESPWWRKKINAAQKQLERKRGNSKDRFLVELHDRLEQLRAAGRALPTTVRAPLEGGDLFVAAPPWEVIRRTEARPRHSFGKRAIQADLNAAANIGLRALLDPDWTGRWWYVPADPATGEPVLDEVKGSPLFREGVTLPLANATSETSQQAQRKSSRKGKRAQRPGSRVQNFWRDLSSHPLEATGERWKASLAYWNDVQARVIEVLRAAAGLERDFR